MLAATHGIAPGTPRGAGPSLGHSHRGGRGGRGASVCKLHVAMFGALCQNHFCGEFAHPMGG